MDGYCGAFLIAYWSMLKAGIFSTDCTTHRKTLRVMMIVYMGSKQKQMRRRGLERSSRAEI